MSLFKLIIKKLINPDNNIFFINYDDSDKINNIIKLLFSNFLLKEINTQNKFDFFSETINNTFLKSIKNEFIQNFCKIQQTYNGLKKLFHNYKYKRSKTVVNHDIGLNEICENQKNIISLLHCNSKYLFSINDLINIINTSLTNNYQFFAEPLCIKNPYNNIPFTKSNLYNIYLFILHKTYYRPDLFFKFFDCDFNLSCFGKKYEILLREKSIHNYVYKSPSNSLHKEINKMINFYNKYYSRYNSYNKICIDEEFPKDVLIKIMQPYLLVYFNSLYSMVPNKKQESGIIFKNMIIRFNQFNPQFGRKKYKILFKHTKDFKKKVIGKIIEFDDKPIVFNPIIKNKYFLTDHLEYLNNYNTLNVTFTNYLIIMDESQHYFNTGQQESHEYDDENEDNIENEENEETAEASDNEEIDNNYDEDMDSIS